MEHVLDCQITKAFQPKKADGSLVGGTGKWGEWKLYNFYTNKTPDDQKFGFMWDEKKQIPRAGLNVKHMEYEIEVKGEFTNYNVKKLELADGAQPDIQPTSTPTTSKPTISASNNKEASFYVSYMKDIAVAIITLGGKLDQTDLDAIARKIAQAGLVMMDASLKPSEEPKKPSEDNKTPSPVNAKDKPVDNPPPPEDSTKIYCPNLEKEIIRRACITCKDRENCPSWAEKGIRG